MTLSRRIFVRNLFVAPAIVSTGCLMPINSLLVPKKRFWQINVSHNSERVLAIETSEAIATGIQPSVDDIQFLNDLVNKIPSRNDEDSLGVLMDKRMFDALGDPGGNTFFKIIRPPDFTDQIGELLEFNPSLTRPLPGLVGLLRASGIDAHGFEKSRIDYLC